jgi:hypothetical protein
VQIAAEDIETAVQRCPILEEEQVDGPNGSWAIKIVT